MEEAIEGEALDQTEEVTQKITKSDEENLEVNTKTTTTTEMSGLRIVDARLFSESGKLESVADLPPSVVIPPLPQPKHNSRQNTMHLSISPTGHQSVTVKSESSRFESSSLVTKKVKFEEEDEIIENNMDFQNEERNESKNESEVPEHKSSFEAELIVESEKNSELGQTDQTEIMDSDKATESETVHETQIDEKVQNNMESEIVKLEEDIEITPREKEENKGSPLILEEKTTEETAPEGVTEDKKAEIQDESHKAQLKEIIQEIDSEVAMEENQPKRHTWQPRGKYEVEKTEIQYEDVIPVSVPDVKIQDHLKPVSEEPKHPKVVMRKKHELPSDNETEASQRPTSLKILRHSLVNGEEISPMEIPIGIPLLAKILPRENEEERDKIPLERLFTPATDWEEIVPQKKKTFASSCFYRPDHPTIDDQVELAHKISVSLVDENNKTSRGQSMYIKRKNKSSKWIHGGEERELEQAALQYDEPEDEHQAPQPSKEKPLLKLVMNSNIAQDFNSVQQHYEEILSSSQTLQQISSMEVGKEIASNLQSPTGKGAALFAKRKKRMDKFIVDETTVQQQQPPSAVYVEDAAITSTTTTNFQAKQESSFASQNQMVTEQQHHQSTQLSQTSSTSQSGLKLPDLSNILKKPLPPQKKVPTLEARGITTHKPKDQKQGFQPQSFPTPPARKKKMETKVQNQMQTQNATQFYSASVNACESTNLSNGFNVTPPIQDPLSNLRPGSPPIYMVPNGTHSTFNEQESLSSMVQADQKSDSTTTNGTPIITYEAHDYATNSGLHPSDIIQVPPPVSSLESDSFKQANNVIHRSKGPIKPVRPCSLPVIPVTSCSSPHPFNLNASPPSTLFNRKLEPAVAKNSLLKSFCVDASLAFNNTNPARLGLKDSSLESRPMPLLLSETESSLNEPSCSEMSGVLAPSTSTFHNLLSVNLPQNNTNTLVCNPPIEFNTIESNKNFTNLPKPFQTQTYGATKPVSSYTNDIDLVQSDQSKVVLNGGSLKTNFDVHQLETPFQISNHKKQDLQLILEELDNIMTFEPENADFSLMQTNEPIYLDNMLEKRNASNNLDSTMLNNEAPSPPIKIEFGHRDSLVNEEELENYISEIERSFSVTPTVLESIDIQDLQPSDFYRSVSRQSLINDDELSTSIETSTTVHINETLTSNINSTLKYNESQTTDVEMNTLGPTLETNSSETSFAVTNAPVLPQSIVPTFPSIQTVTTNTFPVTSCSKSKGSSGINTNISPWSAEGGAIYKAEVKVIQQPSSIPQSSIINFQAPTEHSVLTDLQAAEEEEKRKSFNLAAKGWGTYANYYTPVHLGAR